VEFTSTVGYCREPDVGAPVPVRYLLDDPEQAEIDKAVTWLWPGASALLTGLGLLVAGVVVYLRGWAAAMAGMRANAGSSVRVHGRVAGRLGSRRSRPFH
jgi:hypothetical protein